MYPVYVSYEISKHVWKHVWKHFRKKKQEPLFFRRIKNRAQTNGPVKTDKMVKYTEHFHLKFGWVIPIWR